MADITGHFLVRGAKWKLDAVKEYMWGQCRVGCRKVDDKLFIYINSTTEYDYLERICEIKDARFYLEK